MTKEDLKQTKGYDKMDEISWMRVGKKYVYVIIDWIGGSKEYKITRKEMKEMLEKYDFEYNVFYSVFEHAYSNLRS